VGGRVPAPPPAGAGGGAGSPRRAPRSRRGLAPGGGRLLPLGLSAPPGARRASPPRAAAVRALPRARASPRGRGRVRGVGAPDAGAPRPRESARSGARSRHLSDAPGLPLGRGGARPRSRRGDRRALRRGLSGARRGGDRRPGGAAARKSGGDPRVSARKKAPDDAAPVRRVTRKRARRSSRKIGITCYSHFGGSGVVATELGLALARRGYEVHFIAHRLPFRLRTFESNVFFHEVSAASYPVFEQTPSNLALATKMVEVVENYGLDVLHVHYAMPFAASAYLARQLLLPRALGVVTTLHGTDI